jgi:autophagy-related protein 33
MDFWFHRELGLKAWAQSLIQDSGCMSFSRKNGAKKDEDLVVVEAEEESVNGESVREEMARERRLQCARAVCSGLALAMGIVGLWGDRK